jgi:hypothetical protein
MCAIHAEISRATSSFVNCVEREVSLNKGYKLLLHYKACPFKIAYGSNGYETCKYMLGSK